MEVENKEFQYNISLEAGENIKILINDNEVIDETVPANYKANVTYMYQESKSTV